MLVVEGWSVVEEDEESAKADNEDSEKGAVFIFVLFGVHYSILISIIYYKTIYQYVLFLSLI